MGATAPGSMLDVHAAEIREALDNDVPINALAERYGCARSTMQSFAKRLADLPAEPEQIPGQQNLNGREVPEQKMLQKDGGQIVDSYPEEIRVDGTTQLAAFDVGGKRAQSSSIRLSGGKILLMDGKAFRKGDVITGMFTAIVREVGQRDKPDPQTGIVVSAEQKHVAQIVDLTVKPAE